MISNDVLNRLRCMHSHSVLQEASPAILQAINDAIVSGVLKNGLGQVVSRPFEAGLVNESSTYFYPVVRGVVQMLRDESVDLKTLQRETWREGTENHE